MRAPSRHPSRQLLRQQLTKGLRLALPLGALALLSTIFLASRSIDPSRAVALADLDFAEITREPRIGTARFSGVTQQNAAFVIEAARVRSPADPQLGDPIRLFLDQPDGEISFGTGRTVTFSAESGEIDELANLLTMRNDIILRSSDGHEVSMPQMQAKLDQSRISGWGGVHGQAPAGEISAQQLVITPLDDTTDGYLLDFSGDVRLLYVPDQ